MKEKDVLPNANFDTPEFQELWNLINYQSAYTVEFDSKNLIEKCVENIDKGINIAQASVKISIGEQNMEATQTDLQNNTMLKTTRMRNEKMEQIIGNVKYDLVGEIMRETGLTRRTIVSILQKISPKEFEKYKYNPQGFIKEITRIIKLTKSMIAADGTVYYKLDKKLEREDLAMDFV